MSRVFWSVIIVVLVSFDQFTKWLSESYLPLHRLVDVLPFLGLYRTYNEGISFSFLSFLGPWVLVALMSAIIVFVLWLWSNLDEGRRLSAVGFALVLSGAFGNLIDRISIGKVIDMISFHIDTIGFQFAVFNVADTFITLGAIAILTDEFLLWKTERTKPDGR